MKANEVIKKYIVDNGIKPTFVSEKAGINPELFRRSMDGTRRIPADEFIAICNVLSLNISDFDNLSA